MASRRGYTDAALRYLGENQSVSIAHLVELELPTIQGDSISGYFTDYGVPLEYDGKIYETNKILKISDIREDQAIKVNTLTINVAGEWEEELERALRQPTDVSYVNKSITVYRAFLDDNGDIIDMDVDGGPIKFFKGLITDIKVSEAVITGSSVVSWEAANHFSQFEKVTGRLTDDTSHRGLVSVEIEDNVYQDLPDPSVARKASHVNDLGFMHANTAIDVEAQYKATETRYKMVRRGGFAGLAGMERLVEHEVEVTREIDLRFNLSAQYLPKVYGVRRLGLNPIFAGVDASDPQQVYAVYTVAEGEIDGFLNFYIANKTIICGQPDDYEEEETTICIGSQRSGNTIETSAEGGTGVNGATSIHGTTYDIEDEDGVINITVYHGTEDQLADPTLVNIAANQGFILQGDTPGEEYWGSQHRLLDTAYIVVHTTLTEDKTEIPEIEVVVQGTKPKVWDSTDLTPAGGVKDHTLNMAWHILDYLTSDSGGQIDIEDIDIESFWESAQLLQVEDTSYEIAWVPYWRYIGWEQLSSSYFDVHGNEIPIRAKWQCNTLLNTDVTAFKNVKSMLSQVNGSLNYVGGKYTLSVENDNDVVKDGDGEDTVIDWTECKGSITSKNTSSKDSWNTIDARIPDPAKGYAANSIVFFDAANKAADNNVEKKGRLDFSFILNYYTGRSLAATQLSRSRYSRTFSIQTYYKYSYLKVNDNVYFNYPRFFTNPKKFRVTSVSLLSSGLVSLTLTDYSSDTFDAINQSDRSNLQIPPVIGVRAPTELEILTDWTEDTPANTSFLVKWKPSASEPVLRYDMRWFIGPENDTPDQQDSGIAVSPSSVDSSGKVYAFIEGVNPRDDDWRLQVQVRTVLGSGEYSRWVSVDLYSTDPLVPLNLDSITGFIATNTVPGTSNQFFGSSIDLQWDNNDLPTNAYEIVFYNPNNESTEYSQWIVTRPNTDKETFQYTINMNLADYLANTGTSGILRSIGVKIRGRSDPRLTPGQQVPGYSQLGTGPWAYLEI